MLAGAGVSFPVFAHGDEVAPVYGKECPFDHPGWRAAQTVAGVAMEADPSCEPDNPDVIAAAVAGTNNVPPMVLMGSGLAPDAVVKSDDRDGDGDPDVIHIHLEIIGLNEGTAPQLRYEIAPGVAPAFWTFAPKTSGMVTEGSYASYLMRMPAPVIRVEQGDTVYITVENTHYLPHTIHFHGTDHPYLDADGEGNDGVPLTSEKPILPGQQRTYNITPRTTGTMFYHCHVQPDVHVLMGLQGMFIIEKNRPHNLVQTLNPGGGEVRYRSQASREEFDGEYDLQYQDVDKELHDIPKHTDDPREVARLTNRVYDVTERTPDYFLLNGKSFPYTLRDSQIIVQPDKRYRLRILNGGSETVSLHTHGHKFTVLAYDGVELSPAQRYQRDVLGLTAAQRADVILDTHDDGLDSYGPGVWLFHDHREPATTTNGMFPGGDLSMITYRQYLKDDGFPRTRGMPLAQFFQPAYYQRKVPVWGDMEPVLLGAPQAGSPWRTLLPALLVLLFAAAAGWLLKVFWRRRRGGAGILAAACVLGAAAAGLPHPVQAQDAHEHSHAVSGHEQMDAMPAEPDAHGSGMPGMSTETPAGAGAMQGRQSMQDMPGMEHGAHGAAGGMTMNMPGMRMRRAGTSMVMNENKDTLPPGCSAVAGDQAVTVRAGTRFAKQYPGTMFTYDVHTIKAAPCTRLAVTFVNEDAVRHQFMVHGLPGSVYPGGMFTIEVTGPGKETGSFITPSQTETLMIHCGVPQHEEKGMKAELKNGGGEGDLPNIPGISRTEPGKAPHLPRLLVLAGIIGILIGILISSPQRDTKTGRG